MTVTFHIPDRSLSMKWRHPPLLAAATGLQKCGARRVDNIEDADIILSWVVRDLPVISPCQRFLFLENGWIHRTTYNEAGVPSSGERYHLMWDGHNGNGTFVQIPPADAPSRIRHRIQPMRLAKHDEPILFCGQVPNDISLPPNADDLIQRFAVAFHDREIHYRRHPNRRAAHVKAPHGWKEVSHTTPLADLLPHYHSTAAVCSTVGIDSLILGCSHIHLSPNSMFNLWNPAWSREDFLRVLSYNEWTTEEMASGEPMQPVVSAFE